jgi:hypothetical protein
MCVYTNSAAWPHHRRRRSESQYAPLPRRTPERATSSRHTEGPSGRTVDVRAFQHPHCRLAGSLRPADGFPALRLLRSLPPPDSHQPTTSLPAAALAGQREGDLNRPGFGGGWFCHLQVFRWRCCAVVVGFGFGRGNVADGFEESPIVVPVEPIPRWPVRRRPALARALCDGSARF